MGLGPGGWRAVVRDKTVGAAVRSMSLVFPDDSGEPSPNPKHQHAPTEARAAGAAAGAGAGAAAGAGAGAGTEAPSGGASWLTTGRGARRETPLETGVRIAVRGTAEDMRIIVGERVFKAEGKCESAGSQYCFCSCQNPFFRTSVCPCGLFWGSIQALEPDFHVNGCLA
jgi:hypothetical protein